MSLPIERVSKTHLKLNFLPLYRQPMSNLLFCTTIPYCPPSILLWYKEHIIIKQMNSLYFPNMQYTHTIVLLINFFTLVLEDVVDWWCYLNQRNSSSMSPNLHWFAHYFYVIQCYGQIDKFTWCKVSKHINAISDIYVKCGKQCHFLETDNANRPYVMLNMFLHLTGRLPYDNMSLWFSRAIDWSTRLF